MSKSKKIRILTKQARRGKPHAMYELGIRYQLGQGFPLDLTQAALWISASAALGYAPAIEWLKDYAFDDDALVQAST